jgi:hypothetical protein
MSPNKSLQTKLTGVFNRLNIKEKTPSPPKPPGTPGTAETVLDNDSITTDLASPIDNNYENLQNEIYKLKNEIKILEQNQKNMDEIYKDVPIPATEIADRNGNVLYTRCPFNTHNNEQLYIDGQGKLTLTPMQRNFINSLYVICPLTTKHPKDAPVFDKDGNIIKGEKLFKDSPVLPPQPPQHSPNKSRKRTHKSPSPKTPPQRKTLKTSHSPGRKSKRQKP